MLQKNQIDLYIGQKLCDICKQAGLSRVDLADAIGIQPERLREIEAGMERVPAAVLFVLSN